MSVGNPGECVVEGQAVRYPVWWRAHCRPPKSQSHCWSVHCCPLCTQSACISIQLLDTFARAVLNLCAKILFPWSALCTFWTVSLWRLLEWFHNVYLFRLISFDMVKCIISKNLFVSGKYFWTLRSAVGRCESVSFRLLYCLSSTLRRYILVVFYWYLSNALGRHIISVLLTLSLRLLHVFHSRPKLLATFTARVWFELCESF